MIVQVSIMERFQDLIQQPLQLMKIHHDANRVQLGRGNRDPHPPVMAMERLQRSIIETELMAGGKIALRGDGKHRSLKSVYRRSRRGTCKGLGFNRRGE